MDRALLIALAVAALVLVALLVVGLLAARGRRRLRAELDSSRRDVAALRDRLDELSRQVDRTSQPPDRAPTVGARPSEQFVITTLPDGTSGHQPSFAPESPVSAGAFASVALGESLVRVVSLAYGVRRAMSAENRNRIRFEMQREVKRARRQRRRDLKEARRHLRSEQRTGLTEDAA
jgi:cytochrome c-type biogenesis protein CcmH/NrfG